MAVRGGLHWTVVHATSTRMAHSTHTPSRRNHRPAAPLTAVPRPLSPRHPNSDTVRWTRPVRDKQGGHDDGQNHQLGQPSRSALKERAVRAQPTPTPPQAAAQAAPQGRTASSTTCTARREHQVARTGHQARALRGRPSQESARQRGGSVVRLRRSWAQLPPPGGRRWGLGAESAPDSGGPC